MSAALEVLKEWPKQAWLQSTNLSTDDSLGKASLPGKEHLNTNTANLKKLKDYSS